MADKDIDAVEPNGSNELEETIKKHLDGDDDDDKGAASEEEDPPEKAVIVLGEAMYLQASGDSNVVSLNVYTKEAMMNCLPDSSVKDSTLDEIHLIIKTNKIESLYNPDAIPGLVTKLKSPTIINKEEAEEEDDDDETTNSNNGGMLMIHILAEEGYELMQEDDIETLMSSLLLNGGNLKILQMKLEPSEEDSSRMIVARKI